MKNGIIRKLTSRKFWTMIAMFVTALLIFLKVNKTTAEEIGSLIMMAVAPVAYILGEAWADSKPITIVESAELEEKPPEEE